ncbi:MAG: spermidine synthase [Chromatiales bacterium]|nr:spermidine synthase [Chromatiales bacterium]
MSDFNTVSERALASEGVARCDADGLRVLVGGLGLGATAQAVLAFDQVAHVEVVEFVPTVRRWYEEGVLPLSRPLKRDERMNVVAGDVYARLLGPPSDKFDLILVDVDHSPEEPLTPANLPFYTQAGLQRVHHHLRDDGVLGVWSCTNSPAFEATLRREFGRVEVETTVFQDDLFGEEDEWNYLYFAR